MYEQIEKPKENKSRAVTNSIAQKKNIVKQGFGFVDNRTEDIVPIKLLSFVNNSSIEKKLGDFKNSVNPNNPIQLRSALGMVGLGNMAGDGNLYNIAGNVNLPQGTIFTENLPAATDTDQAIDRYIVRATAIGRVMSTHEFLDKNSQPPNIPNVANFMNAAHVFHANFENWARLAPGTSHAMGRPAALIMRDNLVRNVRNNSRNNANIGLIDPFITRITIPQTGAGNWVFETNWSEAANSYITRVRVGSKNLTGRIRDAGNYNAVRDLKPYAQQFEYSSAHDIGTNKNVGEQIDGLKAPNYTSWGSPTNEENHEGFDAVTKLAAEGARFVPVRMMGTNLKQNSRFFTTDIFGVIRYLSFQEMYANWGNPQWFNRQYGITTPMVIAQVAAHGNVYNGEIDLEADFDLTNDTRAINQRAQITANIQTIVNNINQYQSKRSKLIKKINKKNNQGIQQQIRGINNRIAQEKHELKPYNQHYSDLVKDVSNPAPPPEIVITHPIRDFLIRAGVTGASIIVGAFITYNTLLGLGYFSEED